MRADSVMARGAFRLPNTSGPVPLKSNTALPCQPKRGERSQQPDTVSDAQAPPSPPAPQPDLTQVDLHTELDWGAIVHVVLCSHFQGTSRQVRGLPEGPQHVPHGQLSVCLARSMFAFQVGQLPGGGHRAAPMLLPTRPT